ncbi:MAG: branched-chain amino acid ABC transporter permease [Actinomycetota bacterium]|nr:branched-chain amino acid ABC transporter permease [Actinomycetota bacterium]
MTGRDGTGALTTGLRAVARFRPGPTTPTGGEPRADGPGPTDVGRVGAAVGAGVVALLTTLPAWAPTGLIETTVDLALLVALAQLWNVLAASAGLVSLGQQAFVGVGAYTLVVAADDVGLNVFLAVPAAALVAAVLSLPVAALVLRVGGATFAVATLVVAQAAMAVVAANHALGGTGGRELVATTELDAEALETTTYWLALVLGVGAVVGVYLLSRTRLGLALDAMRDDTAAAARLGVDPGRTRLAVWVLAAAVAGAVGAVAHLGSPGVDPASAFDLTAWTVPVVFVVVLGGVGTIEGPIVGALVYVVLGELLFDGGPWFLVLAAIATIAVAVTSTDGLWGLVRRWRPVVLFTRHRGSGLGSSPDAEEG